MEPKLKKIGLDVEEDRLAADPFAGRRLDAQGTSRTGEKGNSCSGPGISLYHSKRCVPSVVHESGKTTRRWAWSRN